MGGEEPHARLWRARRPLGERSAMLTVGDRSIRLEGLRPELLAALQVRWGAFLRDRASEPSLTTVQLRRAGSEGWLGRAQSGEAYRVEAAGDDAHRLVVSYYFAVGAGGPGEGWRVAVTDRAPERLDRIVENAIRVVVACLAVDRGGFAMHAAAVARDGRAWILAGPSGAGKSTAVGLLAPAIGLGDDFALVVPSNRGWGAPALPFDNSERIRHQPPTGLTPVAAILRLYQDRTTRVEPPPADQAVASLMACTAFPWAMPERASALLGQVARFVAEGGFRHLHFARDADLWSHLNRAG
jgi:hypothetical protein